MKTKNTKMQNATTTTNHQWINTSTPPPTAGQGAAGTAEHEAGGGPAPLRKAGVEAGAWVSERAASPPVILF